MNILFTSVTIFAADTTNLIKEGHALHLKILSKYPRIDSFYRQPFIQGSGTNNPISCISLPEKEWNGLSDSKKKALSMYAQSLINKVKANPFKYSGVSSSAPAAGLIRANVNRMSNNSWGIMVGDFTNNGSDIISGRIVGYGKQ
jgi:hypothetical protein